MLQTFVETLSFQKFAAQAGMVEKEIVQLIDCLAANPDSGDEIKGTGRSGWPGRGKGKSALRTVTKEIVETYERERSVRSAK